MAFIHEFLPFLKQNILRIAACGGLMMSVISMAATAHETSPAESAFTIDSLMSMKSVSDVKISPDGLWVAYVVKRMDEDKDKSFSQIWISSIEGGDPIPMTASYRNASSPRWSPDGKDLAFLGVRGVDEDAKAQIWLLDRRGGEARQHSSVKQGVNSFAYSPSGDQMVLVVKDAKPDADPDDKDKDGSKKGEDKAEPWVIDRLQFKRDYVGYLDRRRTHLYLFDGEKDPIQITSGDYDDANPVWSPDGDKIAFVSKREGDPDSNDNSDIWTVDAAAHSKSTPLVQVTDNTGPDSSPVWSPDGQSIAYITSTQPEKLWYDVDQLAVTAADGRGGARILMKDYDRFVYAPAFAPDGKSIYALARDGGDGLLINVDLKTGARKVESSPDTVTREFDIANNETIAYLRSSHEDPYDVYARKGSGSLRLTKLNKEILGGLNLARVERLKVKGWQGEDVESFIYYPHDYEEGERYPVIFNFHGGPVSQHDSSFDNWGQLYAAQGYIAVLPNPHGSSGYGEAFSYALNQQWGTPDFADIEAITDYLIDNDIADESRIGIGGWSYGGILTNYMITQSTRYTAAVSGASEVNHRANYGHDIYQHYWEAELGLPWENIEGWERMNPFNDLGKVTTPTLVIGGHVDWNVPIQNSEQLYQALKRIGTPTQLVVYPNEHHGISRPSFVRDRYDRYLDWYEKYLD
ncbi:MAG: S9 family peptidase [Hellea sp.]